jgi:hypothetical protein
VCTDAHELFGRETPCALRRLRRKECPAQLVKPTGFGGQDKGVVGSDRLWTQEAAHAIFDGQVAGADGGRNERSVEILELTAVGALWILEEDHAVPGTGIADKDSALGCMAGRGRFLISRIHCYLHIVADPGWLSAQLDDPADLRVSVTLNAQTEPPCARAPTSFCHTDQGL